MVHVRKISRSKQKESNSSLKTLDNRVKSSSAWKGDISMLQGESMLSGQSPFTYVLSEGLDKYHYILHYVGADQKVHYKNVRIRYVSGVPIYRNGGGGIFDSIEDLVVGCLQCSSSVCKPLY